MTFTPALITTALCTGLLVVGLPAGAQAIEPPAIKPPTGAPVDGGFNGQTDLDKPAPVTFELTGLTGDTAEVTITGAASSWISVDRDGVSMGKPQLVDRRGRVTVKAPLAHGEKATFTATQTRYLITDPAHIAHTSDPASFDVVSDVSELAAPEVTNVDAIFQDSSLIRLAGRPGATVTVKNSNGEDALKVPVSIGQDGTTSAAVLLRSPGGPIGPRFTVTQSFGGVTSAATAFHKDDRPSFETGGLTSPRIETSLEQGRLHVLASTTATDEVTYLHIEDLIGNTVSNAPITRGKIELYLQVPVTESQYTATVRKVVADTMYESAATRFVANEGIGQLVPDAPVVDRVDSGGSRAVATVTGLAGAIVTARNADGTIVAVKTIGRGAQTAQLVVPNTGRAGTALSVTQKTGAVESDPVTVDLAASDR